MVLNLRQVEDRAIKLWEGMGFAPIFTKRETSAPNKGTCPGCGNRPDDCLGSSACMGEQTNLFAKGTAYQDGITRPLSSYPGVKQWTKPELRELPVNATGNIDRHVPNGVEAPKERPVEDVSDTYVDTTPKTVQEPPATLESLMERARKH